VRPSHAGDVPQRAETDLTGPDLQRERCLLFVALTRARDHLYISYSGSPSAFLR
jgi:superfamily I DNA/RNA helicase